MRLCIALVTSMLLAACAGQPGADVIACAEPRPQVCTMEYAPVCAQRVKGGRKQYSSPCNACADDTVESYRMEACEE